MENTKLLLFRARCPMNELTILTSTLKTMDLLREKCGYTFPLPMPVAIEVTPYTVNETTRNWWGKPVTRVFEYHQYFLVFDVILTESELNLWRMFKAGWHARVNNYAFN